MMTMLDDVGPEKILVSHSNDHFVLTLREALELRKQLARALAEVPPLDQFEEEDG